MEALFIVPTMVSPNVNPKLIPSLIKAIERNIILNHSSVLRTAAVRKYASLWNTARKEGVEIQEIEYGMTNKKTYSKKPDGTTDNASSYTGKLAGPKMQHGPAEDRVSGSEIKSVDQVEFPRQIVFFNSITLEPTYLEVPLHVKSSHLSLSAEATRVVRIGVKCVPYTIPNLMDIMALMSNLKNKTAIQRLFYRKKNNILKRIPFSKENEVYKGIKSGDSKTDIIFAPAFDQLSAQSLAMAMNTRKPSSWSSLTVLSMQDFGESELKDNLDKYRQLVEGGWGDMIIVNEIKESAYFCVQRMMSCYEMPFSYLKLVMNLGDTLDYREIKSYSRPFGVSSVGRALSDSAMTKLDDLIVENAYSLLTKSTCVIPKDKI